MFEIFFYSCHIDEIFIILQFSNKISIISMNYMYILVYKEYSGILLIFRYLITVLFSSVKYINILASS